MFLYGLNEKFLQRAIHRLGYAIADAVRMDPLQLLVPTASISDIPKLEEIAPIITACCAISPRVAVGLMGSRARGTPVEYSDWDLGITCGVDPLTTEEFLHCRQIANDLGDDLPRCVDVVNLDQAPGWFLQEMHDAPKFLAGNDASWAYFLGVLHGVRKKIT